MRRRLPQFAALALGLLALSTGTVWAASSSPSPTTSTTSTTSSSTLLPGNSLPPGAPTTTTRTGSTTSTTRGGTTTTTTSTIAPAGSDTTHLNGGVIPPEAAAEIARFPITPPGTTAPLLAALRPLTALGLSLTQAAVVGFGRFPIAGAAIWSDSFLEPRFTADGAFKFHHAIDIPAACGTPLRAPDEGTLTQGSDSGGGTTVEITEPDGTYMYLAHLAGYADGAASGQHVRVGDVVGFVGQTGDATGCHLHLEIHPQGGQPVDPKPFVDAWYADALREAPILVDAIRADRGLPPVVATPDAIADGLLGL